VVAIAAGATALALAVAGVATAALSKSASVPVASQSTSTPVSSQSTPPPEPSQSTPAPVPSQSAPAPEPTQPTFAPPLLAVPAGGCTFGSVCVAANGILTGGAMREQYANDPDVHVARLNTPPAAVGVTIYEIPASGTYTFSVTYENYNASDGLTEPRDMSLLVNGQLAGTLNFAVTGSWYETYSLVSTASVQAPARHSTFTIACQVGDSCHINVWKVELS
jgi:hypothetical protein